MRKRTTSTSFPQVRFRGMDPAPVVPDRKGAKSPGTGNMSEVGVILTRPERPTRRRKRRVVRTVHPSHPSTKVPVLSVVPDGIQPFLPRRGRVLLGNKQG